MADSTAAPIPQAISDLLTNGLNIKINASGQLPGESIISALINYAAAARGSMDKDLMARLDAVTVQQIEDMQHVWRGIWKALGVVQ